MTIQTTANIWHNGKLIPWDQAQIHVMSHVVHYGSSVFEGIRCYTQPNGAGCLPSARTHGAPSSTPPRSTACPCPTPQISSLPPSSTSSKPMASRPCYIRPIAFRGYGEMGVNPLKSPVEVYIANFPWGKYVHGNEGADVCISSWARLAPNTMPTLAKGRRQLHELAAHPHGGRDQRLLRGHRPRHQRLPLRGLRRKPLPRPWWRPLHVAAGRTPCSMASRVTPSSRWPNNSA